MTAPICEMIGHSLSLLLIWLFFFIIILMRYVSMSENKNKAIAGCLIAVGIVFLLLSLEMLCFSSTMTFDYRAYQTYQVCATMWFVLGIVFLSGGISINLKHWDASTLGSITIISVGMFFVAESMCFFGMYANPQHYQFPFKIEYLIIGTSMFLIAILDILYGLFVFQLFHNKNKQKVKQIVVMIGISTTWFGFPAFMWYWCLRMMT